MNQSLLVSVIIPVYNVKPYICESLESVINQTYQNLEIIVVDDGSTDGSGEICNYYKHKDSRICVIHQENRGLSEARNTGLDTMHGEAVAFLDSDDALLPNMIEIMVQNMISTESDIVACGFFISQTVERLTKEHYNDVFSIENRVVSSQEGLRLLMDNKVQEPEH